MTSITYDHQAIEELSFRRGDIIRAVEMARPPSPRGNPRRDAPTAPIATRSSASPTLTPPPSAGDGVACGVWWRGELRGTVGLFRGEHAYVHARDEVT